MSDRSTRSYAENLDEYLGPSREAFKQFATSIDGWIDAVRQLPDHLRPNACEVTRAMMRILDNILAEIERP